MLRFGLSVLSALMLSLVPLPAYADGGALQVAMSMGMPDLLPLLGVIGVILVAGFSYRKVGG